MIIWVFYSLASAFFFGLKDIIAKKFMKHRVTPKQLLFEEYFLLLIFVLFVFFPHVEFQSYKEFWLIYLIKAISVGGANLLYLKLLKSYEISSVSPIINLSPLILLFMAASLLGEVITNVQLLGVIIVIVSTYFLEITIHHHRKSKPHQFHVIDLKDKEIRFHITAALILVLFSVAAITDKMILSNVSVYTNLYFTSAVILVMLIIYYIKEGHLFKTLKHIHKEPETMVIAIFSIISEFLILIAISVPGALVSLIIPLRRTSTLFSSIFGGMLFHEKHLKKKIVMTLFMLVGVILIVWHTGLSAEFIK